ncbi:MAG: 3-oxo-5-alpha-steroid 4-dehydrogenase [Actinobacteria bacterium RBG_16_64_13]|nr:MAG: 3-oxo-5-alpha-steroid 4-dehydrogenase [Actinobacteria bacterium RBG_16_64_13]
MNEITVYHWLVIAWMALAAVTFVALLFVTAPYGRFTRSGWGPRISARWGWILMETPVLATFLVLYGLSDRKSNPASLVLLAFWAAHYVHRSLVYPFRLRSSRPTITVAVVAMGAAFNVGNGYLNGRYLFSLGPELPASWLLDPRFVAGALLFWGGYLLNQHSDHVLIGLRSGGETGYKIPYGGGYRFVSCPNYLGEMMEWGGWALACWNLGALAFLVWTVANLAPRALKTHRWYRDTFPDYPRERKALLPFIV